ncbi:hypothetical protein AB0I84_32825 [Streptomyces spectabilis]
MEAAGADDEGMASQACPQCSGTMLRPPDDAGNLDPDHQWLCGDCGHTTA